MNPLVSFCLKSYNGRRYLREALAGAFAQTYRPLEIVVSDDASTDGSWEEISGFCASHAVPDGVTLKLNRNPTNLGSLGNWERLCELAEGVLLVKADGDDISTPDRVERIMNAWERGNRRATVICHSGWQIGADGSWRGHLRQVTATWPLGAAMAFVPETFRLFGRMKDGSLVDDVVYANRGLMLGPALEMPDRLVYYRQGSGMTTDDWNIRKVVERCMPMSLAAVRSQLEQDAPRLRTLRGEAAAGSWRKRLGAEERRLVAKRELVVGRTIRERWKGFRGMGGCRLLSISGYLRVAFLMPRPVGSVLLLAYVALRYAVRRLTPRPTGIRFVEPLTSGKACAAGTRGEETDERN